MKNDVNVPGTRVPDADPYDPYVSGPPGSASGPDSQRYRSKDPDPHPDPYQNVTDPQLCHLITSSLLVIVQETMETEETKEEGEEKKDKEKTALSGGKH